MTTSARSRERPPGDREDAVRRLRLSGGRMTRAKQDLLDLFFGSERSLTVDQVNAELPAFDETTVYRTLAQFEQAGILEHVHLGHGAARYRRAGARTVPALCDGCGTVVHIGVDDFDGLVERVRRRHGMTLEIGHFALSGRCAACTAADA